MTAQDPKIRDLRKIWGGAKLLGLDSEILHDLVREITGKESIKALNATERAKVIFELQDKGAYGYRKKAAKRPRTRPGGKASDGITENQQKYIHHQWVKLAQVLPEAANNPWRVGFCKQLIGIPWPQTKGHGARLIEALKKRLAQEKKSLAKIH
jgi:hypothetical protein